MKKYVVYLLTFSLLLPLLCCAFGCNPGTDDPNEEVTKGYEYAVAFCDYQGELGQGLDYSGEGLGHFAELSSGGVRYATFESPPKGTAEIIEISLQGITYSGPWKSSFCYVNGETEDEYTLWGGNGGTLTLKNGQLHSLKIEWWENGTRHPIDAVESIRIATEQLKQLFNLSENDYWVSVEKTEYGSYEVRFYKKVVLPSNEINASVSVSEEYYVFVSSAGFVSRITVCDEEKRFPVNHKVEVDYEKMTAAVQEAAVVLLQDPALFDTHPRFVINYQEKGLAISPYPYLIQCYLDVYEKGTDERVGTYELVLFATESSKRAAK